MIVHEDPESLLLGPTHILNPRAFAISFLFAKFSQVISRGISIAGLAITTDTV